MCVTNLRASQTAAAVAAAQVSQSAKISTFSGALSRPKF